MVVVEKPNEPLIRRGLMGKKELEAMFDLSFASLRVWIEKGLLPEPVNRRPVFKEVFAVNAPLKWDIEEVMDAFERMRAGDGKEAQEAKV